MGVEVSVVQRLKDLEHAFRLLTTGTAARAVTNSAAGLTFCWAIDRELLAPAAYPWPASALARRSR